MLDCDGVLYPLSELATKDIVGAMKYVYRNEVGLTPDEQKFVSEKTIAEQHLGMFNYIKEICNFKQYDFDEFCASVVEKTDYSGIKQNKNLWQTLMAASSKYNVSIFTNNSRPHLEKVLNCVFAKGIADLEKNGISVYDIKSTEKNGYFFPKQTENGFKFFLKRMNLQAEKTILFDDAPINIERAISAGMKAILVTPENSLQKELHKLSCFNITNIKTHE